MTHLTVVLVLSYTGSQKQADKKTGVAVRWAADIVSAAGLMKTPSSRCLHTHSSLGSGRERGVDTGQKAKVAPFWVLHRHSFLVRFLWWYAFPPA